MSGIWLTPPRSRACTHAASVLPIGLDSGISPRQPSARKLSLLGPRPSSGPGGLQCLPVTRAPSYAVPTSCTSVQRDDSEARASPWSASAGCALDSSAFFTGTPGGSSFLRALTPSELLLVTASHSRVSSSSGVAPHDQRLFAAVCHAAAAHSDAHGGGGPDCRSAQSSPSAARTSRGSAAAAATRVAAATLWSALSAQPSPPHVLHGVAGVQLHKQMPSGAVAGPSPSPPGAPTAFHPVDEACIWSPSHGPHGGEAASGALSPQQQWRRIDTWDHSAAADAGPSLLQRSSILGAAGGTAAGGGGAQTEKDATVMQLLSNIRQRRRIMHQQQQQQWCAARSATRGHAKRSASMTLLQVRPSTTATLRQHAAASQSATGADSPSDDAGGRPGSGGPGGINCPVSDQEAPVGNRSFTRWASLGAQRQAGGDRPSTSGLGAQPVARVARVRTSSDLRPAHLVCGEADGGGGAEELVAGAISALSAFVGRSGGSTGAVFMEPAPRGSALGDVGAVGAAQGAAPPSDSLPQRVPSVSAR